MSNTYKVKEIHGLLVPFLAKRPDRQVASLISNPDAEINIEDDTVGLWLRKIVADNYVDFANYIKTGSLILDEVKIEISDKVTTLWYGFIEEVVNLAISNDVFPKKSIKPTRRELTDDIFVPIPYHSEAIRFHKAIDLIHATPDSVFIVFPSPELLVIKEPKVTELVLCFHIFGSVFYIVVDASKELEFTKPEFDLSIGLRKELLIEITPDSICTTGLTLREELTRLGYPEALDFTFKQKVRTEMYLNLSDSVIKSMLLTLPDDKETANIDTSGVLKNACIDDKNSGYVITALLSMPNQQRIDSGWDLILLDALENNFLN